MHGSVHVGLFSLDHIFKQVLGFDKIKSEAWALVLLLIDAWTTHLGLFTWSHIHTWFWPLRFLLCLGLWAGRKWLWFMMYIPSRLFFSVSLILFKLVLVLVKAQVYITFNYFLSSYSILSPIPLHMNIKNQWMHLIL